jgi:malate synthase
MSQKGVFEIESAILEHIQNFLEKDDVKDEDYKKEIHQISLYYEELLDQAKLITKVSDRLQNKLNKLNSKLNDKNDELQQTIDELTKAKVGRKATTIALVVAVILFLLSEGLVEPQIESYLGPGNIGWGLAFKGVIALLLKPIEVLSEKLLMKKALKDSKPKIRLEEGQPIPTKN